MLFLDFEDSIAELEAELANLRHDGGDGSESDLQGRIDRQLEHLYSRLSPWQTVQVARHPDRPTAHDVIQTLCPNLITLHGDRMGGDAPFVIGGLGRIRDHGVVLIGHDRAHNAPPAEPTTPMANGLRKTARMLQLAERFRLPAILISGAAPSETDASISLLPCLETLLDLRVPVISVLCGALSGPACALYASTDLVLMLEHACLSAVTPEHAATAFWPDTPDATRATLLAAESLCLTSASLRQHHVIDDIIPEPLGGAHRHPRAACQAIGASVVARLETLRNVDGGLLRAKRRERLAIFGREVPAS